MGFMKQEHRLTMFLLFYCACKFFTAILQPSELLHYIKNISWVKEIKKQKKEKSQWVLLVKAAPRNLLPNIKNLQKILKQERVTKRNRILVMAQAG